MAKHQATNEWFKPMIRILKNMRGKLVETGVIGNKGAPSYFLQGLRLGTAFAAPS